ncbi:MAG TPA: type II toxin-antitoxin system HigB family toxin [Chitinophagales bacterium]|nr:type II toxin-antitoxin system HigB family toxin [Chitinophagales bacterium]
MRIIKIKTLKDFWKKHPDAEIGLRDWHADIESKNWQTPNEVIAFFKKSDTIGNNRIVFNIEHNKYRLIVLFRYKIQVGFVRFIGTHKEYDKINDIQNI